MLSIPDSQVEKPVTKVIYHITCGGGPVSSLGSLQEGWDMVEKF